MLEINDYRAVDKDAWNLVNQSVINGDLAIATDSDLQEISQNHEIIILLPINLTYKIESMLCKK